MNQIRIFYAMLAAFIIWLAVILGYVFPMVLSKPDAITSVAGLLTAFGMGGVTVFFTTMLTLIIQFFVRKKPPTPEPK